MSKFRNLVVRWLLKAGKFTAFIPDKLYLEMIYPNYIGKKLNLANPSTFNEKLQWLKLYDRNPLYTTLVDKYNVRKFVAERIGEEYLIPLCTDTVWSRFEDIDFRKLPDQFVLKCTHDSGGGVVICKDKSKFNRAQAKEKISKSLAKNYYYYYREWAYKNVPPRIIAETLIGKTDASPKDYKFFCFNGEPKFLYVATDRFVDTKINFYTLDFERLDVQQDYHNDVQNATRPENYDQMLELAKKLAAGFKHIRVDFYNVDGKIYFGELTMYSFAGLQKFVPETYDYIFGDYIKLE